MARRNKNAKRKWNPRFAALCLLTLFTLAGAGLWWMNRGLPGEKIQTPDWVEKDYLTVNPYSRPGTPLTKINGVVIHYVGNPGTTAKANRSYFETLALGADAVYASAHFVVGLEGEVVQCIPLSEISYASNSRNEDTVAVEVCHPDDTGAFAPASYDRAVELTAWLCKEFKLNPQRDVLRHYDVSG
ncbi:MAG: peptidoglycan recognition family protein, partial [Oscillibacter sp.]